MAVMKAVSYGPEAWKYLKGIFCVYKPSGLPTVHVRNTLCLNLCRDLNQLERKEMLSMVCLKGSVCSNKPYEVEVVPNYADHELVTGPRYQLQDIRMAWMYTLGHNTSGVMLMAVNDGCRELKNPIYKNVLRKYEIKGKFGVATKTFMSDGIVIEKSTYHHIRESTLDRYLGSIETAHQSLAFKYSDIDIQSQEAYELASSGLVKPTALKRTDPLIYSIKCTEFNLPYFTLEVHCINETEEFLAELVHDIGMDLRSTAVCMQLRQTQFGYFDLSHALLRKHWTLENILNNLTLCQSILKDESNSANCRTIKAIKQKNVVEDMQRIAREDKLL